MSLPYVPRRLPESHTREIRGLHQHCLSWVGEGAPLVLLHGFMDCAATFQFVVDALPHRRAVVAPDWRGFGRSAWSADGYWFPDYLADLEAWLDQWYPGEPADIVGHSMGGNIALVFAGLRPERVRRLVTLEGFGLPGSRPELAPGRYRDWLNELRVPASATTFPSLELFVGVLRKRNPRLTPERAAFVAGAWSETLPDGRVRMRFDPAHRRVNPVLYRREEAEACWRQIRAPVLYVVGAESDFMQRLQGAADPAAMIAHIPQLEPCVVAGSGHMLHHDQPAAVARLVEDFVARPSA